MKKVNVFLIIGLIGLVITAVLQYVWPNVELNLEFGQSIEILYPIFIAVSVIGFGLMLKVEKKPIDD